MNADIEKLKELLRATLKIKRRDCYGEIKEICGKKR